MGCAVGQMASFSKTITETDVYGFAGITGDFNPLHVDAVKAEAGRFGERIAHGMLSASFISTVIATRLPGPGTIYMGQEVRFLNPVRFGDTITATVVIEELLDRGRVRLHTFVENQKGETVVDGYALVKLPERKEKGKMDEKRRIVIAGAGVMGGSIALLFARHGYEVAVYDIEQKGLDRCRKRIQKEIAGAEIIFTREKECFARAGFVVEAIVENIEAKHLFWREISSIVSERAILTTNTSGLSVTQIAEAVKCPRRFCGMHWLNPPHICPLIEVIKGEKTDAETAEAVRQTGLDVGRVPVMLEKEVPGFLINRFQFAILREAMSLVEAGAAKKEDIDKVFKYGLGLRYACLGPFEIADLGGLDTFYRIASYLFADLCDEKTVMPMLTELVENGDYGVKTGKGFYEYLGSRAAQVITKRDEDFEKLAECLYRAETRIHQ